MPKQPVHPVLGSLHDDEPTAAVLPELETPAPSLIGKPWIEDPVVPTPPAAQAVLVKPMSKRRRLIVRMLRAIADVLAEEDP